jgi:hypothetical protein
MVCSKITKLQGPARWLPAIGRFFVFDFAVSAQRRHFLKLELDSFPAAARLANRCFEMPAFTRSHRFGQPGFKVAGAH